MNRKHKPLGADWAKKEEKDELISKKEVIMILGDLKLKPEFPKRIEYVIGHKDAINRAIRLINEIIIKPKTK